jgi:hypothetical protein
MSRFRRLVVVVLLVIATVGLAIPSVTLADDCSTTRGLAVHAGLSPSQRSIVLTEGQDPANFPLTSATAQGLTAHAGLSPSQLSIVLLEGQDPGNIPAEFASVSGLDLLAGMSPSQHSIMLVEGRDPANFPTRASGC